MSNDVQVVQTEIERSEMRLYDLFKKMDKSYEDSYQSLKEAISRAFLRKVETSQELIEFFKELIENGVGNFRMDSEGSGHWDYLSWLLKGIICNIISDFPNEKDITIIANYALTIEPKNNTLRKKIVTELASFLPDDSVVKLCLMIEAGNLYGRGGGSHV